MSTRCQLIRQRNTKLRKPQVGGTKSAEITESLKQGSLIIGVSLHRQSSHRESGYIENKTKKAFAGDRPIAQLCFYRFKLWRSCDLGIFARSYWPMIFLAPWNFNFLYFQQMCSEWRMCFASSTMKQKIKIQIRSLCAAMAVAVEHLKHAIDPFLMDFHSWNMLEYCLRWWNVRVAILKCKQTGWVYQQTFFR